MTKTIIRFISKERLQSFVSKLAQEKFLGKIIKTGISKFLITFPSPICKFWISEVSLTPWNSGCNIFSFLKNCNSILLISVEHSFILQKPLNGLSIQQLILSIKHSILNLGTLFCSIFTLVILVGSKVNW